jgi:hypothetical protein
VRKTTHHKTAARPAARTPILDVTGFEGQWVAINPKTLKVLGHGPSPDEAIASAGTVNGVEPGLYYVPKSDAFFIGRTA